METDPSAAPPSPGATASVTDSQAATGLPPGSQPAEGTAEAQMDAREELKKEWEKRKIDRPYDFDGWPPSRVQYTLDNLRAMPMPGEPGSGSGPGEPQDPNAAEFHKKAREEQRAQAGRPKGMDEERTRMGLPTEPVQEPGGPGSGAVPGTGGTDPSLPPGEYQTPIPQEGGVAQHTPGAEPPLSSPSPYDAPAGTEPPTDMPTQQQQPQA